MFCKLFLGNAGYGGTANNTIPYWVAIWTYSMYIVYIVVTS